MGAVGALAHEVDLPARVKDRVLDTKDAVQAKVDTIKQRLHMGTDMVQHKADEATQGAKKLTNETLAKLTPPAAGRVKQLTETVRQRPVLPVAAVVLSVLVVLGRLLRRKS